YLQLVMLCHIGTEADTAYILQQLSAFTDTSGWEFAFATDDEIKAFYSGVRIEQQVTPALGTPKVFITDSDKRLRGRKRDAKYDAGYSTFHPSELSNEMLDDFKIILYEYRAALKKNNNATKRLGE